MAIDTGNWTSCRTMQGCKSPNYSLNCTLLMRLFFPKTEVQIFYSILFSILFYFYVPHLWLITPMATCNLFLITDINQSPPCKNAIFGKVNVKDHQFFVLQECAARTLTGVKLLFWSILQFSEKVAEYILKGKPSLTLQW